MNPPKKDFLCVEIRPIPEHNGESMHYQLSVIRRSGARKESILMGIVGLAKIMKGIEGARTPFTLGHITIDFTPYGSGGNVRMNYQPFYKIDAKSVAAFYNHGIAQRAEDKILDHIMKRAKGHFVDHDVFAGSERERQLRERGVDPSKLITVAEESAKLKKYLSGKRAEIRARKLQAKISRR